MSDDQTIVLWIRKTEALAKRLGVQPSEVYDMLTTLGYTGARVRTTVPTDVAVAFVGSLFRPEEILPVHEVAARFDRHPQKVAQPQESQRYVKQILTRNCGERGARRFRRVRHGAYRLQLTSIELRSAVLDELKAQRTFVGSKRLMELFDISYERLIETLTPLVNQNRVISRVNDMTNNRDWCLQRYAEVFSR